MGAHFKELQDKFQHRFEVLDNEISKRDDIINRLKNRIVELERATEGSLTVSCYFDFNIIIQNVNCPSVIFK